MTFEQKCKAFAFRQLSNNFWSFFIFHRVPFFKLISIIFYYNTPLKEPVGPLEPHKTAHFPIFNVEFERPQIFAYTSCSAVITRGTGFFQTWHHTGGCDLLKNARCNSKCINQNANHWLESRVKGRGGRAKGTDDKCPERRGGRLSCDKNDPHLGPSGSSSRSSTWVLVVPRVHHVGRAMSWKVGETKAQNKSTFDYTYTRRDVMPLSMDG